MNIGNILGHIILSRKINSILCSYTSIPKLWIFLSTKLKWFNLIGVENIENAQNTLTNLELYQLSCPYTHEQYRSAAYCWNMPHFTCSCFLQFKFYDEAFSSATFLINRLLTLVICNMSPFEKLINNPPDYKFEKFLVVLFSYPYLRPCFSFHKMCIVGGIVMITKATSDWTCPLDEYTCPIICFFTRTSSYLQPHCSFIHCSMSHTLSILLK